MKKFWKYHAIGNDFIIMDDADFSGLDAISLCDRHKGIGADGILLYRPHSSLAAEMIIINSDGSIAEMCGNGLRCFAHWLRAEKGINKSKYAILTGRGTLSCSFDDTTTDVVSVELGSVTQNSMRQTQMNYNGIVCNVFTANVGNNHLVVVPMHAVSKEHAADIAEHIEYASLFNEEVNVEVVYAIDPELHLAHSVVYERGVGFTLGCGTGAAAIYAVLSTRLFDEKESTWKIRFPGGTVSLCGDINNSIQLSGEAVNVYHGEIDG